MILIDSRQGSKEFVDLIAASYSPTLCTLEFADFAFTGNGPDGDIFIGVERKTIPDLTASIRSGRFQAHQLPGMIKDYDRVYLLIEGITKPNDEGFISSLVGRQWKTYPNALQDRELAGLTTTLEEFAGVRIIYSRFPRDSANRLQWLYSYWQKSYHSHTAHLAVKKISGIGHKIDLVSPNLITRVLAQLPGVGIKKARDVSKRIHTISQMASAPEEVWESIPGIGKKTAQKIVKSIQEGEK